MRAYVRARARLCARGIQCTEQCTGRCIYTREIIAIGGALVSSRYIDLPASSWLLPKSEDFLPPGRKAKRAARSERFPEGIPTARGASTSCEGFRSSVKRMVSRRMCPPDCRAKRQEPSLAGTKGPSWSPSLLDLLVERHSPPRGTMTFIIPFCQHTKHQLSNETKIDRDRHS
jgi:hypothetical protein